MAIIVLILVAVGIGGGALWLKGYGDDMKAEGRAECQQAVAEANKRSSDAADKLKDEVQNHTDDMVTAYEQAEKEAGVRTVYVTKKGASDVQAHPEVFNDPHCVLPADALRNLNTARSSFRGAPHADVVRVNDGASTSTGPRPAADTGKANAAVRGAVAPNGGNDRGNVPADASGRRPLGKVRP